MEHNVKIGAQPDPKGIFQNHANNKPMSYKNN